MAVVKVEPPKNGISALIKIQRASQPSAKESATLKRALTQPCRHPDLPVSKTVREKFLLFISSPLCGIFVIASCMVSDKMKHVATC